MAASALRMTGQGRRLSRRALDALRARVTSFAGDASGNYAMMTVVALLPVMGALAVGLDFAEMNRQKQTTLNALDAAALATARHVAGGASDAELIAYANDFFEANLSDVDPADTTLYVTLPSSTLGGGTLKMSADLRYSPYFFPAFETMLGKTAEEMSGDINFKARTEVRLKNTLEVALVLDNSGSMDVTGTGSGQKRIDLLKAAAKQLVDKIALQASMIKQVEKPVQFALVPFAASVNVGPDNAGASWMDTSGLSPVHHENFDWSVIDAPDKRAEQIFGIWYKKGIGWGLEENEILSRFSLFKDMKKVESREWVATGREYICTRYRSNGTCREGRWEETGYYDEIVATFASWQGCVESRPAPYNTDDSPASGGPDNTGIGFGDPATMFVPMFAPDEPGDRWDTETGPKEGFGAINNWWNDGIEDAGASERQRNMTKYFDVRPFGASSPQATGPNYSCTTNPITPLTDVSDATGLASIKAAIDLMAPNGGTNVPEGMAWGWRTVSSGEPFAQGRPNSERGNDKVVIVLTDGENTYYTPGSLGYSDPAGSKSIYSSHGYLYPGYNGTGTGRLFTGTSAAIGQGDYSNSNYTNAMNEHMDTLCNKAKAAGVLVMTVALDLNAGNTAQAKQIAALKKCSSDSRFRKDPADPSKADKLFWNASGGDLAETFKKIADELSNLRIVG